MIQSFFKGLLGRRLNKPDHGGCGAHWQADKKGRMTMIEEWVDGLIADATWLTLGKNNTTLIDSVSVLLEG